MSVGNEESDDVTDGLKRVTLNLTVRAQDAIRDIINVTSESKTDAINRALLLYNFFIQTQASGGALYVRDTVEGEVERLRLL